MTHKTLIGGTAYEIKGGRTLVGGTGYDIKSGKSLVGGTAYDISFLTVSTVLNDNDWGVISSVASASQGANYWAVGDCKAVTLDGTVGALTLSSYTTYAFIIGFNHNSTLEGTGRIHFQLAKTALSSGIDICFVDSYYGNNYSAACFHMNTTGTNSGGWKDSYMRNSICGQDPPSYSGVWFTNTLPTELRSIMKSVTKYTDNTGGGTGSVQANVTATTDYVFLLSEYEVFGSIKNANTYEANYQEQYAYYSAGNSKVKRRNSSTSSTAIWWLRSPRAGTITSTFVIIDTGGTVSTGNAKHSYGFAPCFCV